MPLVTIAAVRSLLFAPANRSERFAKAEASGADGVIVDLEDAVPAAEKDAARAAAIAWCASPVVDGVLRCVRVNAPSTPHGLRDLLALLDAPALPDGLMIPKVEHAAELGLVATVLATRPGSTVGLLPLIESARGLSAADAIASHPATTALVLGGADLAADLGAAFDWDGLRHARGRIVQAAAVAGRPVLDVPSLDMGNEAGLIAEVAAVRKLGFTGKLAIHPKHVRAINEGFAPTAEDVARAERIVAASTAAKGGVCVVDGRMVDAPVVRAAERTLLRRR